jgi:hypothetical protein
VKLIVTQLVKKFIFFWKYEGLLVFTKALIKYISSALFIHLLLLLVIVHSP